VAANIVSGVPQTRPARAILRAVRGYALVLWASVFLATSPGSVGPRLVALTVTLGSAAVAVSLVAPGLPVLIMLLGVLLVLVGVTTGALLIPRGRPVGLRLVPPAALTAVTVGAMAWAERGVLNPGLLVKLGVVVLVVLLGAYVGRVRPPSRRTASPPPARSHPIHPASGSPITQPVTEGTT
jgi:hypothetical protein